MNILTLTKYDTEGASSRYRILQYASPLRSAGIQCTNLPLLAQGYLALRWTSGTSRFKLMQHVVAGYWRRARLLIRSREYDLMFVEKELLPYIPYWIERLIHRGHVPVVYDLDDAVYLAYRRSSCLRAVYGKKYAAFLGRAAAITVGSHALLDYARQFHSSVYLIPTVVDLSRYTAADSASGNRPFRIGWIGSQSTTTHLAALASTLRQFCLANHAQVMQIGGDSVMPGDDHWIAVPWSEDTEGQRLSEIDVGIMPLPNTEWARGKCAFKLIQYMASSKPVIASPTGENQFVVQPGINGYLASTPEQWTEALHRIYVDRELGKQMGMNGRRLVEQRFNLNATAPTLATILSSAAVQ